MTRKGKIASLPATIREEVNRRLFDGERGPSILKSLNENPDVLRILESDAGRAAFGSKTDESSVTLVTAQNLSEWRNGGYQDWLAQRETVENTKILSDYAFKLAKAGGGSLSEGAAAIAGGRILQLLEQVARGEKPTTKDDEGEKSETSIEFDLEKLVNAVATLGHVEVAHKRETRQREELALDVQRFQRQTAELFIKWHTDKRATEIAEGKGSKEVKTEKLVELMFGQRDAAPSFLKDVDK